MSHSVRSTPRTGSRIAPPVRGVFSREPFDLATLKPEGNVGLLREHQLEGGACHEVEGLSGLSVRSLFRYGTISSEYRIERAPTILFVVGVAAEKA